MAEHSGFEVGKSAPMDYREHQKTYFGFLWLVRYGTAGIIAILIGMLMGLIVGAGVIMSVLSVIITMVVLHFAVLKGNEVSTKH